MDKQTDGKTYGYTYKWMDGQTFRLINRQTDKLETDKIKNTRADIWADG